MRTYYVGMDVHSATIAIAVLNGAGKVEMELTIKTGAELVRGFLKQLRGRVYVTFEEGTQATWLHDVVRPLVRQWWSVIRGTTSYWERATRVIGLTPRSWRSCCATVV